ncbi:MAG: Ig-like domain-containing protein, partial [bacterium]|nr:Ig-like domain-containing protein [bacterium]
MKMSLKRMWVVPAVLALSLVVASCHDHDNLVNPAGDTTPPTVAPGTPASGATGVAIASTVTATFSEEMDNTTITGTTFTVKAGATGVTGTVGYAAGTYVATFTPSSSLAYSTTYTVTVTTGVKDLAGNALAADNTWTFTTAAAPSTNLSWAFVDNNGVTGLNQDPVANSAYFPQLTAFNGKLYATWQEGSTTVSHVVVYNGNDAAPAWAFVDGALGALAMDSSREGGSPQLTVHGTKLYATWYELDSLGAAQMRVAVYNDNDAAPAWTLVDGGGLTGINRDGTQSARAPQLTSHGGNLYAAWMESAPGPFRIRASVYNGNDSSPVWTRIEEPTVLGLHADNTSIDCRNVQLTEANSKLYATWVEWDAGLKYRTRVAVFNDNLSAPAWTVVDGGGTTNGAIGLNYPGTSGSKSAYSPQLTDFGGRLYATWFESGSGADTLRVAVYDGNDSSPVWTFVDGGTTSGIGSMLPGLGTQEPQ